MRYHQAHLSSLSALTSQPKEIEEATASKAAAFSSHCEDIKQRDRELISADDVLFCAWNLFGKTRGWTSRGITARHGVVTWSSCHPLHIKEALIRATTNRIEKKKHCTGFLEYQVDCYSVLLYTFLTCRGPRMTLKATLCITIQAGTSLVVSRQHYCYTRIFLYNCQLFGFKDSKAWYWTLLSLASRF